MYMSEADAILIEVWNRLTSDWSRLTTFRQMGVLGEDSAREAIHRTNTYYVQQSLLNGEHRKLLKDPEGFVKEGFAEVLPNEMTEHSVKEFRRTLHAATLVFAHSILDAAVYDCVRICAIGKPDLWAEFVQGKKVSLGEVSGKSYSELMKVAISADVSRLERESLIAKVDRVYQVCRPAKATFLTNGFVFDRDRLTAIDKLRHNVVHAPGGEWAFDGIYEDIQFLQNSGLHVFSMVGVTFGLCFSGTEAIAARIARNKRVV